MATQHSLPPHAHALVHLLRQDISPVTFLAEILQNARRARATGIWIRWNPLSSTLTVRDNGRGISSFDRLTAVGQPHWDNQVMFDENPSGIGFLAVILATDLIVVRSHNWSAAFATQQFLDLQPANTTEHHESPSSGTHFILCVKPAIYQAITSTATSQHPSASVAAWRKVLEFLVKGFPIPVYFDNDPLPRPDALNGGGHFLSSDVGQFCLRGWENCSATRRETFPTLYCQGLPLERFKITRSDESIPDILHLPNRTPLALPNRNRILNVDDVHNRIIRARDTLWRTRLIQQAARIPIDQLALRHWDLCVSLNRPDLLQQAPLVPSALHCYERPLTRNPTGGPAPWTQSTLPTAKDIFIYEIDPIGFDLEKPVTLASLYAAAAQLPVLTEIVPDSHWSHQRAVDLLDPDLGITYTITGKTRSAYFVGQRVSAEVVVCDSLTIWFSPTNSCKTQPALIALLPPQTVTQWPLYDVKSGQIIVPSGANAGPAVLQIHDYQDSQTGHSFRELCRHDQNDLADLVRHLRNNSPSEYLNTLLSRLSPDPEFIGNSAYCVQFDHDQARLVVAGQPASPAPSNDP